MLQDAVNDKGKVTKASVKEALKNLGAPSPSSATDAKLGLGAPSDDEYEALTRCLTLIDAESEASKAVKDAQAALDEKVLKHYAKLSEAEIKTLVVDDKWFASIQAAIEGEVQRLTQQLGSRVKELEERYAQPLPQLERKVDTYSSKVEAHLKKMGLTWA